MTRKYQKTGLNHHPLYEVWFSIKRRCYNPNRKDYKYYGGRGIKICEEWKEDYKAFFDWCIANGWIQGLEIDREDNDKDYTPSNCRIVTHAENSRNSRFAKLTEPKVHTIKQLLERNNLKQTEIANLFNVNQRTISAIKTGIIWKEVL